MSRDSLPLGPCGPVPFDEVVVADTETTGLFPFGLKDDGSDAGDPHGPDRLCSLSGVTLRRVGAAWEFAGQVGWTVDPGRHVPEGAAKVNGFAWSPSGQGVPDGRRNLAGEPGFDAVVGEFLGHVGGRPLVFHNAVFDMAVLDAELCRCGLPMLENPVLCTKKAFADMRGLGRPDHYIPGTNLNALCDLLGVDRSDRVGPDGTELHGAAVDALLAARCFMVLEPAGWMAAEAPQALPHRVRRLQVPSDPAVLLRRAASAPARRASAGQAPGLPPPRG